MPVITESLLGIRRQEQPSKDEIKTRAQQGRLNLITTYHALRKDNSPLLLSPEGQELQKALHVIQLATIYGQSAGAYFDKGTAISLTNSSQLSQSDGYFEFGLRTRMSQEGEIEDKLGVWFIKNGTAAEASSDLLKTMIENGTHKDQVNKLTQLKPDQIFSRIEDHLIKAML